MISIRGRSNNDSARLDHANRAIQHTLSEIIETDKWVEEVQAQLDAADQKQQVELNELREELKIQRSHALTLMSRIDAANKCITDLQSKPVPLIPDVTPIRAEIGAIRALVSEIMISHNEELTYLWKLLRDETVTLATEQRKIHTRIDRLPTLNITYIWLASLTILNILTLVFAYVK